MTQVAIPDYHRRTQAERRFGEFSNLLFRSLPTGASALLLLFLGSRLLFCRLVGEELEILGITFFGEIFDWDEAHGGRVHAVALAGGGRAVVEDVAEMGVAVLGTNFLARVEELEVSLDDDVVFVDGFPEGGPAGTGFVLLV